jgi:hypothetical protein
MQVSGLAWTEPGVQADSSVVLEIRYAVRRPCTPS